MEEKKMSKEQQQQQPVVEAEVVTQEETQVETPAQPLTTAEAIAALNGTLSSGLQVRSNELQFGWESAAWTAGAMVVGFTGAAIGVQLAKRWIPSETKEILGLFMS
jgi:hypothetical protein